MLLPAYPISNIDKVFMVHIMDFSGAFTVFANVPKKEENEKIVKYYKTL